MMKILRLHNINLVKFSSFQIGYRKKEIQKEERRGRKEEIFLKQRFVCVKDQIGNRMLGSNYSPSEMKWRSGSPLK